MSQNHLSTEPLHIVFLASSGQDVLVLTHLLNDAGCDTTLVTGGLSEISSDKAFPCPVVLLEMALLHECGWSVLDVVRMQYREPEIVIVTRDATLKDIVQSVCAGIAEYVRLPVSNLASFLARLHELAALWENRQRTSQEHGPEPMMVRQVESWIQLQFHQPMTMKWQQVGAKFHRKRSRLSLVLRQGTGLCKREMIQTLRRDVLRIALRECDGEPLRQIGKAIGLKREWSLTRVCYQLLGIRPQEDRAVMQGVGKLHTLSEVVEHARRLRSERGER